MTAELRRVAQAAHKAAIAHEWRDIAIREAVRSGHSLAEVAKAAGLTRGRIHQIVRGG